MRSHRWPRRRVQIAASCPQPSRANTGAASAWPDVAALAYVGPLTASNDFGLEERQLQLRLDKGRSFLAEAQISKHTCIHGWTRDRRIERRSVAGTT